MEIGKKHLVKINLPGGIMYPGDLVGVLAIARRVGVSNFRFGNRQQLFFWINEAALEDVEDAFLVDDIAYEIDADDFPNIISSYVTEEILNPVNWLREGVYKDILNNFNHRPKLKINIVDQAQNLIPFFTGHLNFISSETSNYWYLHIRFPKSNEMYNWPTFVYSEDIPDLSEALEDLILCEPRITGAEIYQQISKGNRFFRHPYQQPLQHTGFQLPYYEGFNRYGDNKLWLGLYMRKEEFSIDLLDDIAEICIKTRIGQLYTTAWKSIVIKNIHQSDRKYWSNLLDKHRVNVRHAANELNWQLEDVCEESLNLKQYLVKCFEEADLRTYRLCFAIKTKPKTGLFGSIIIKKNGVDVETGALLYQIQHTRSFNPNSKEFIVFKENAKKEDLAESLAEVCRYYYSLQNSLTPPELTLPDKPEQEKYFREVFECRHCKTIYDDAFGDVFNNIAPGTKFEELMEYICPVCEASKDDFLPLREHE